MSNQIATARLPVHLRHELREISPFPVGERRRSLLPGEFKHVIENSINPDAYEPYVLSEHRHTWDKVYSQHRTLSEAHSRESTTERAEPSRSSLRARSTPRAASPAHRTVSAAYPTFVISDNDARGHSASRLSRPNDVMFDTAPIRDPTVSVARNIPPLAPREVARPMYARRHARLTESPPRVNGTGSGSHRLHTCGIDDDSSLIQRLRNFADRYEISRMLPGDRRA